MTWHLTDDLAAFDAAARAFIEAEPLKNTLLISIPTVLRDRGPHAFGPADPRFGWYDTADGTIAGALVQTPPHPLLTSALPAEAAASLVNALKASGKPLVGINAPAAVADAVAAAWCAQTGDPQTVFGTHRLYVLDALIAPDPAPPGKPRIAAGRDRDVLAAWFAAFAEEIGDPVLNVRRAIDDRLEFGGLTLWEVDGAVVSMAGITRLLDGDSIRIGPVYTPKDLRGHGYAAAATATATQTAIDRGARVVSLFTDLDNPTSNALYQRLGYRAIEDRKVIRFEPED